MNVICYIIGVRDLYDHLDRYQRTFIVFDTYSEFLKKNKNISSKLDGKVFLF